MRTVSHWSHIVPVLMLIVRLLAGAFLIPYVIYLFLVGMPLVLLELAYGQFSSLSPIEVWKMSPLFQGKVIYLPVSLMNVHNGYDSVQIKLYLIEVFICMHKTHMHVARTHPDTHTRNTRADPHMCGCVVHICVCCMCLVVFRKMFVRMCALQ
jgi:Sodium:neurotransmitter symporter family